MPRKKPPTDKPPSKEPTASTTPPPAKPDEGAATPDQPVKPITTREKNRTLRVVRAIEAFDQDFQEIGFAVRDFVLCGLPYKRPEKTVHERRNGSFTLRVVADPTYGLPFGQDRLIPLWLATAFQAAGKPENNVIRFRCASDILRAFQIPVSGIERARLRERIRRTFGATYFGQDERNNHLRLFSESYRLIRRLDLWFDDKKKKSKPHLLWGNSIELDPVFADDLRRESVPIDMDAVRALKESPAALDLYLWQAWRSYRLTRRKQKPVEVPVFGEGGLLAQLGSEVEEPRKARQLLRHWQELVKLVWRGCPNELNEEASVLRVRAGMAVHPGARLELPGVSRTPPSPRPFTGEVPDLSLMREPPPASVEDPSK
jgi:hypothetical protein